MKKNALLVVILASSVLGHAQTLKFTLANPQPNFMEVYDGSFASGDVDGDGDKDLLMTGQSPARQTKLYLNNGTGNFTEATTNLPQASSSVTIFKDLDKDNDLDLFFSGINNVGQTFTHIYTNNGSGVFTQVTNAALPSFVGGGAAIDDVDGDGDQDIIISALTSTNVFVADVYLNNGRAVFTAQGSTAFTAVKFTSIAFIDIEKDGDKDVLISGKDANNVVSLKLYQNNGLGNFTLNTNSTFASIGADDIDVADTDNDGDLDFVVSGSDATNIPRTILYTNNGSGVFTQKTTNLQQTFAGQNAFGDLDNDGDQDLLIVGSQNGGLPNIRNIVYKNTGNNVFVPADTLGGEYIAACIIDDFTGDGLRDIVISGFVNKTNVYWNTSRITSTVNPIVSQNAVTFFPNPANGLVNFKSSEKAESVMLYNLLGQEVLSKQVDASEFVIDISNLLNGTYIAKLNMLGKSETVKLVKK
jgi:hypothetical protein